MERLSSGLKINSAADDVAGYAINQRFLEQVNGVGQAQQNLQDSVSMVQTAQGALNDVQQMLQRVRELAVQYANGTNTESDKEAIEGEGEAARRRDQASRRNDQVQRRRPAGQSGEITFQVGANEKETIAVKTTKLETASKASASKKSNRWKKRSPKSSKAAAKFGAVQDRLQYTQSNLAIYGENLSAAQSSLVDVNMAAEMSTFTKDQVLMQAGVAILAQANSLPQVVLKLIG